MNRNCLPLATGILLNNRIPPKLIPQHALRGYECRGYKHKYRTQRCSARKRVFPQHPSRSLSGRQ